MANIGVSTTIREAKKADMIHVMKLIKELAEFEKLSDQVQINETVLMEDGFTNQPAFKCLVAELENEIVGYAIYYQSYSTWLGRSLFLEDVYVQPNYRQHGIGKRLFLTVAKIAYQLPSKRMDFHVLSWNPAIEFYRRIAGAINLTQTEQWQLFRLDDKALTRLFSNQF